MQPFDANHYEKFLESREKAMAYLHKFYIEEQAAQYHLMMYMRKKKPPSVMTKKQTLMRSSVPYPEDMEFSDK